MGGGLQEPDHKISIKSIAYWRLLDVILHSSMILLVLFLYLMIDFFKWPHYVRYILLASLALTFISFLINYFYVPVYKQKYWRYQIDERYIQVKNGGLINVSYKVIPMDKVQYVHTTQNFLSKKFGLSNVKIATVAHVHEIPTLPVNEAKEARKLIAENIEKAKGISNDR